MGMFSRRGVLIILIGLPRPVPRPAAHRSSYPRPWDSRRPRRPAPAGPRPGAGGPGTPRASGRPRNFFFSSKKTTPPLVSEPFVNKGGESSMAIPSGVPIIDTMIGFPTNFEHYDFIRKQAKD